MTTPPEPCDHDECYYAEDDNVPGDQGVCCDCGAVRLPRVDV